MTDRRVVWPSPVRAKLLSFRSPRFTPEETFDFITQVALEAEQTLINPVVSQHYTEDRGQFRGISRMMIRGFKVYFEVIDDEVVILAIKFPREK